MNFFDSGYVTMLAQASLLTIQLALSSLVIGLILAIIFTLGEMNKFKWIAWPTTLLVTMFRGLPELLVVLFLYFGSSQLLFYMTGEYIEVSAFTSGSIALGLIFAAYAAQTMRGALKAVPTGQKEAAKALGLGKVRTFIRIILPQATIQAIPGLSNQWLVLLKDTALVSLIGVTDLLKQSQLITAYTHDSFTWYATAAGIYLVITLISRRAISYLNKKLAIPGLGADA